MTFHIFNGDCLAGLFKDTGIKGQPIVCREALIDGPLSCDTLPQFWQTRAKYLEADHERYRRMVVSEFDKITAAPDRASFNLWFGYDLFCQVNLWFTLSLLQDAGAEKELYMVYPSFRKPADIWKEFGGATTQDLIISFTNRVQFGADDLQLAKKLWRAYKSNDLEMLEALSHQQSALFPYLRVVCQAHIERFPTEEKQGRPEAAILEIIKTGSKDFHAVFKRFFEQEGIYGFGDVQLKKIYDQVMPHN